MMDIKTAVAKLDELQKVQYAYSHAMGILFYDAVTTAPKDTAEEGELPSGFSQERCTGSS